jgi:hypothetical protein
MKIQYENRVMSSLLLYMDHYICKNGEAFSNKSSFFYPTEQTYTNLFNYSSPFKQFISDDSVPNATVMKTAYVNSGGYKEFAVGTSGLSAIDHNNGLVQMSVGVAGNNPISGNYSIKDFNIYLTNKPEEQILFETKYHLRPDIPEDVTGLPPDTQTFPAIFVKSVNGENTPGYYGGTDLTNVGVRAIVLADSAYDLDAVCSILKDRNKTEIKLIEELLPFNAIGAYTGGSYNYTGLAASASSGIFIDRVSISKNVGGDYNSLNPNVYPAFVDFELNEFRKPRS